MIRQSTIDRQIGRRYGFFTVLAFARKENRNQYFYECRCDCGTVKTVRASCLQQGTTKSCGCFALERNRTAHAGNTYRRIPKGEAAFNTLYRRYIFDAERRGMEFGLSKGDFRALTSGDCFYCGAAPSREYGNNLHNGKYRYSGVDRVDNNIGYIPSNCVPCCVRCNSVKNGITKEMVYKIYHHLFPTR
jgi:hypothetical protein